jgi:hypothetical protein
MRASDLDPESSLTTQARRRLWRRSAGEVAGGIPGYARNLLVEQPTTALKGETFGAAPFGAGKACGFAGGRLPGVTP